SPEKNKETRSTDASAAESALTAQAAEPSASKPFPIVGIGASAGGLEAFTAFLKALPADTGMAFVLIQHMDPTHESMLNRLLAKDTAMDVTQIVDGMDVEPNRVYVIAPNTEDRKSTRLSSSHRTISYAVFCLKKKKKKTKIQHNKIQK